MRFRRYKVVLFLRVHDFINRVVVHWGRHDGELRDARSAKAADADPSAKFAARSNQELIPNPGTKVGWMMKGTKINVTAIEKEISTAVRTH